MAEKPSYEELEQRVRELEAEAVKRTQAGEALHKTLADMERLATGWKAELMRVDEALKRVKKVHKQVEQRTRFLNEILTTSPLSVIATNSHGNIIYANPFTEELFGYQMEELIGKNPEIFNAEPDSDKIQANILDTVRRNKIWKGELLNKKKNGELFYLEASIYRLIDEKGDLLALVGFQRDITRRKQTEKALRESEERYRNLMDNVGIGVVLINHEMEILALNNQVRQWFPWANDTRRPICYQVLGYPPRDEICSYCPTQKTLKDGKRHEVVTETANGQSLRHYRVISTPNRDKDGKITSAIEIIEDITERKRAEEALLKREAELKAKTHDLGEVNSALRVLLKQMNEDRDEFEENVLSNVKQLVIPYLLRLKSSQLNRDQMGLIEILESNLNTIVSPFVGKLSSKFLALSPMEIRVADLVKEGKTNKEIADLLCLSENTILSHRYRLRTKLDLKNKGVNLRSYLVSHYE
jgi:PAS domain S-box-containing protein